MVLISLVMADDLSNRLHTGRALFYRVTFLFGLDSLDFKRVFMGEVIWDIIKGVPYFDYPYFDYPYFCNTTDFFHDWIVLKNSIKDNCYTYLVC